MGAIVGPETWRQKFSKSTAPFDLLGAVVTAGALLVGGLRYLGTGEVLWGSILLVLAVVAVFIQGFKARWAIREQAKKDSVHELQGCLYALETVLLAADLEPARRRAVGLRLTIHTPDDKGCLEQVMNYVGDQRGGRTVGRKFPENAGVAGQAYRQAVLDPDDPELFLGSRATEDYNAFIAQMVSDYGFTPDAARKLNPATMSWLAFAITNQGRVEGVLYCDAQEADFFNDSRQEDVLHAMVGIAYFVGVRYS